MSPLLFNNFCVARVAIAVKPKVYDYVVAHHSHLTTQEAEIVTQTATAGAVANMINSFQKDWDEIVGSCRIGHLSETQLTLFVEMFSDEYLQPHVDVAARNL